MNNINIIKPEEEEILFLWRYINKLEFLLVNTFKSKMKYKKLIKEKLKSLCRVISSKGIRPEEIMGSLNDNILNSNNYNNLSSDSEAEDNNIEYTEKFDLDMISKIKRNTGNDNDTESDSDFEIIAKNTEKNNFFEDLDKITHLQNFIYNNNLEYQKLKENNAKGNQVIKSFKGKKHSRAQNNNSEDSDSNEASIKRKKIE